MFLNREEREERKRQEKKIVELEERIKEFEKQIDEKDRYAQEVVNENISKSAGKWEYLELEVSFSLFSAKDEVRDRGGLQRLGGEGWELTSILPRGGGNEAINSATYYFKRRIVPLSKEAEIELGNINQEKVQLQDEKDRLSKELEEMR